ncbi:MAG: protein kinase [Acidobacteriota bacterium]|nr:protein kinase [Acidobacteriota bacterium]
MGTQLGRGAMGEVYQARDPLIGRPVALKVITSGLAGQPELLDRFYQEARSAGTLQHPNIVTIYDLGKEGELPFIAMEYLSGESLEKMIARRQSMAISRKVGYIVQTCRALEYAHKHGVVHRDIKPANIMVTAEGVLKVVDFGIARLVDASKTQTGALIGTLGYMSPQQLRGERADERSDIWAVGVMFYELLAFQRPFSGDNPAALVLSIISSEPAPLANAAPGCPAEVEAIIFRMLQKDASRRYQSMEEALLDLDPVWKRLQGEQVNELVARGERLIEERELKQAQLVLREALQVDSTCQQAKAFLDTISRELRRQDALPQVQERIGKAQDLLAAGQWQQARAEAQAALNLDSMCEQANELLAAAEQAIQRADEIDRKLRMSKERLAAGELTDADRTFEEILTLDPKNQQARELRRQVREEIDRRDHRKQAIARVHGLISGGFFEQAVGAADVALADDPGNADLLSLRESARVGQREQQRRDDLDKRIREIESRIQRDELTDAIDLARDTIATLGADTRLAQLLQSAESERQHRETRKAQNEKVAEAQTLLDAGKTLEASQVLDHAIATQLLNASDPRVDSLYGEVEKRNKREQAAIAPPLTPTVQPQAAPSAAPVAKKRFPLGITAAAAAVLLLAGGLYFAFHHRSVVPQTRSDLNLPGSSPLPAQGGSPQTQTELSQPPSPTAQPPVDPLRQQQQQFMEQAQKLVVAGQFDQALEVVDRALKLNGPLQTDLEHLRASIQKASSDKAARAALQKEDQLWNTAVAAFGRNDFPTATRDFRRVAAMRNGVHQTEAQDYLNNRIPQARAGRQLQQLIGEFGADSGNKAALQQLQGQFRKLENVGGTVGSQARDYAENRIPARIDALLQPATAAAGSPSAPSAGNGGNVKPAAEVNAYNSFLALPSNRPQDIISSGETFLKNYPQSPNAGVVYSRLTRAYQITGQDRKMLEAGRNALKVNPDNVDVLSSLAYSIPRHVDVKNPASGQLLLEVKQYAGRAISLLSKMQKPANLSEEQFTTARNSELAACHSGLGLIDFYQNNIPGMIGEMEQAVSLNPRPNSEDQYLLGVAYAKAGRWSDAENPLEECSANSGPMQQRCRSELADVEKNVPPPSLFALHNDCLTVVGGPAGGNGAAAIAALHNHCSQALSVIPVVLNPKGKGGDGDWCKVDGNGSQLVQPGGDLALGDSSLVYCEKSNCSDVHVKWNATFASDHQRTPAPQVQISHKCPKAR